jgi:hypothetical protein
LSPELDSLGTQQLLIHLADLFEDLASAGQVGDLAADEGDLIGMKADLAGLAAGIDQVEHPLTMTLATGAGGAGDGGGVEGMPLQQGATEKILERGQGAEELAKGYVGLSTSHLSI